MVLLQQCSSVAYAKGGDGGDAYTWDCCIRARRMIWYTINDL